MKQPVLLLFFMCHAGAFAQSAKTERIVFGNFTIRINNFFAENRYYSRDHSTDATLNIHTIDTVFLDENPCDSNGWYIAGTLLQIIPRFRGDSFDLSFAYEAEISENEGANTWTYISKFLVIPRTKKNQFSIPEYKDHGYKTSIKKKYNLQDTSVRIKHEGGTTQIRFARNGKLVTDTWNYMHLRIRRFVNGHVKETKFIVIGLSEGCD